jgi:hypothetical protein
MKLRASIYTISLLALTGFLFILLSSCVGKKDSGPPTVTISSPAPGSVVFGKVPVIVTAWDEKKVETTRLFIDGQEITSVDGDYIHYSWDTDPVADNLPHHISAFAIDDNNNVGPSAITTVTVFAPGAGGPEPQVVSIQNPIDGQTVSGIVNVSVGVIIDDNNPIDSVVVYIDGQRRSTDTEFPYIYSWDVNNLVDGSLHTIYAISYDRLGFNVSSEVINVTISSSVIGNITAPIVQIDNPIDGQTVSGLVNVVARVDNIEYNSVDSVLFVIDGFRKFSDTQVPYIYSWDVSNLPNGSRHTIFVVAYDQLGFNVSSGVIEVTVSSNVIPDLSPPTVNLVFPAPTAVNIFSASILGGITIVADAI